MSDKTPRDTGTPLVDVTSDNREQGDILVTVGLDGGRIVMLFSVGVGWLEGGGPGGSVCRCFRPSIIRKTCSDGALFCLRVFFATRYGHAKEDASPTRADAISLVTKVG